MKPLRSYTTEQIARLPEQAFYKVDDVDQRIYQMNRASSLKFAPEDVKAIADERDKLLQHIRIYEGGFATLDPTFEPYEFLSVPENLERVTKLARELNQRLKK